MAGREAIIAQTLNEHKKWKEERIMKGVTKEEQESVY
jgi:hypothetical protein